MPFDQVIKQEYLISELNNKRQKKIYNSSNENNKFQGPNYLSKQYYRQQMKKSLKVKKLIDENGIEVQNFTMVLRLKKIIEELNLKIRQQDDTIMQLKRDSKTTKINQMQVQIQHLNDQNKRLVLLIEEIKQKYNNCKNGLQGYVKHGAIGSVTSSKPSEGPEFVRNGQSGKSRQKKKRSQNKKDSTSTSLLFGSGFSFGSQMIANSKKSYPQAQKQKEEQMREQIKEKKFQKKYYQLLEETEKLKKELINLKLNEQATNGKKRRSCISIDKNSAFFQKNMENLQKITQKKHELQVQNQILKGKLQLNEKKIKEIQSENQSVYKVVENLKNELKHKTIMQSDRDINNQKSQRGLLKDVSNTQMIENALPVETC